MAPERCAKPSPHVGVQRQGLDGAGVELLAKCEDESCFGAAPHVDVSWLGDPKPGRGYIPASQDNSRILSGGFLWVLSSHGALPTRRSADNPSDSEHAGAEDPDTHKVAVSGDVDRTARLSHTLLVRPPALHL